MRIRSVGAAFAAIFFTTSIARAELQCTLLHPGPDRGTIKGKVTAADNPSQGVPGFVLFFSITQGVQGSASGINPSTGDYIASNMVVPASYVLEAQPTDGVHAPQFYNGVVAFCPATPIDLSQNGQVADGIDFSVIVGATVSGTVRSQSSGDPLANVEVEATAAGPLQHTVKVHTDASGQYTLTGLAPTKYRIKFTPADSPDNYVTELYDDKLAAPGDTVNVTLPGISGIDAALAQGGRIEGHVTDSDGQPLVFGRVQAIASSTTAPYDFGIVSADSNGDYSIVVPAGTYKVILFAFGPTYTELYDDKLTLDSADDVSVTAPQTTSGIDMQLKATGFIEGTVTDAVSGNPIGGATVTAIDLDRSDVPFSGSEYSSDSSGSYILQNNLHSGNYKVKFSAPGHRTEFYSDKPSADAADLVAVTAPDTTHHINAALEPCDPTTTTTVSACLGTTTTFPETTTSLPVTTTLPGGDVCGDPVALIGSDGDGGLSRSITASDALSVLRAAVGSASCQPCVCDVNDSGGITASDALIVLRRAVGQVVDLLCPPCS